MIDTIIKTINNAKRYLEISSSTVDDLTDIFLAAFDRSFLEHVPRKNSRITGEEVIAHPLISAILNESYPLGVAELLELALYLKSFCHDPSIGDILVNLKNPRQYHCTMFQLAMAFRVKKIGTDIRIEPPTMRGKADLSFIFNGSKYIGECYRIGKTFLDYFGELKFRLFDELLKNVPKEKIYTFTIKIGSILTFDGMRRLLKHTKLILNEFNNRTDLARADFIYLNHRIGVEDITDYSEDPDFIFKENGGFEFKRYLDANAGANLMSVNVHDLFRIRSADKERLSRIFYWNDFEGQARNTAYDTLPDKINKKLKQTKVSDSKVGRVLFVDFPFGLDFQGKVSSVQRRIQAKVATQFNQLSGVLLTERRPYHKNRFMYRGIVLLGEGEKKFPYEFIKKLNESELSDIFDH